MKKTHKTTQDIQKGYQEPEWLIILKNLIKEVKSQKEQNATTISN